MDAQALQQRIYEWNSLHLDLFEITLLKEVSLMLNKVFLHNVCKKDICLHSRRVQTIILSAVAMN